MNRRLRSVLLLALLLALPAVSAAVPSVVIESLSGASSVSLYPLETADFFLRVSNSSPAPVENLTMFLSVDPPLALVAQDGREYNDQNIFLPWLAPGESKTYPFRVKAGNSIAASALVRVNYGFERFTHSASTVISIEPNPLLVGARLSRGAIGPNEDLSLFLDLTNNSQQALTSIQVQVELPGEFSTTSKNYSLEDLNPTQSVLNREFKVRSGEVTGQRTLVVRVLYLDEHGPHSLEKAFMVEVEDRSKYLVMFVAVVFVFVVLSFFLQAKEKRHKILGHGQEAPGAHPEGHEEAHHAGKAEGSDTQGESPGEHASHAPTRRRRKILPAHEKPFQESRRR